MTQSKIILFVGGIIALLLLLYIFRNQSYIDQFLQLLIVLFTFLTAYSAYQSSRAAEQSTRATFLPIIKLEVDEMTNQKFRLTVKNIGTQLAQNVHIYVEHAYVDPDVIAPYRKTIHTLEIDSTENEYLNYSPNVLATYPYITVTYQDVFGGVVKTVGTFVMRKNEQHLPEEVDGIIWQFSLNRP